MKDVVKINSTFIRPFLTLGLTPYLEDLIFLDRKKPIVRKFGHRFLMLSFAIAGLLFGTKGNGQSTSLSGVVNDYTTVQGLIGSDKIVVNQPGAFSGSDRVLIIQMQGATVDETNNPTFGSITDTASAGMYEFNSVCSISGDTLILDYELIHSYAVAGKVQVVLVPHYSQATVTGTLSADAWNGSTGGVIAIEVSGTLTLSANINAEGKGFQGGIYTPSAASCSWFTSYPNYYYSMSSGIGLTKGQGISPIITGKECGKGPQGNGGGGGNNHNAGGGGGGHAGAGGKGGNNNDPGNFNCHGYNPGLGGVPLSDNPARWYFGGGGGSGHGNNSDPGSISSGGAGGGIVFIKADSLIGNGHQIKAGGAVGGYSMNDGAGGAGAGGTVILNVNNYDASTLSVDVSGGDGGDADNDGQNRCFGPGGGGGGGMVYSTNSLPAQVTVDVNGGSSGETINSTGCSGTLGATDGGDGTSTSGIVITESASPGTSCPILLALQDVNVWIEQKSSAYTLYWKVLDQTGIERYMVEYQHGSGSIYQLAEVPAEPNATETYSLKLPDLAGGTYYFRIGVAGDDIPTDYSHWISIKISDQLPECQVTPNFLGVGELAFVHIQDLDVAGAVLNVFDVAGRRTQLLTTRAAGSTAVQFSKPGVYFLTVTDWNRVCQSKVVVTP